MPTNITSVAGWVTPQTVATGDAISSTVWNNLVGDVAMLYGKPWFKAFYTAASTSSPFASSTTLSTQAGGTAIFNTSATGGTVSTLQNSPTSGLGSFSMTNGAVFFPTSSGTAIPGLYRITAHVTTAANSNNFQRLVIRAQNGSGTILSYHAGPITQSSTGFYPTCTITAIIPVGYGTWANCTNFYITGSVNAGTAPIIEANDAALFGPSSSPPSYNTILDVEYLGTSNGTF